MVATIAGVVGLVLGGALGWSAKVLSLRLRKRTANHQKRPIDPEKTDYFEKVMQNPDAWQGQAEGLFDVGRRLISQWNDTQKKWHAIPGGSRRLTPQESGQLQLALYLQPIATMLFGLAMENMLKALIVATNPDYPRLTSDARLDWGANGHDLVRLSEKSQLALEPHETWVLKEYSKAVVWKSRYPLPIGASRFTDELVIEQNMSFPGWSQTLNLFIKIRCELTGEPYEPIPADPEEPGPSSLVIKRVP